MKKKKTTSTVLHIIVASLFFFAGFFWGSDELNPVRQEVNKIEMLLGPDTSSESMDKCKNGIRIGEMVDEGALPTGRSGLLLEDLCEHYTPKDSSYCNDPCKPFNSGMEGKPNIFFGVMIPLGLYRNYCNSSNMKIVNETYEVTTDLYPHYPNGYWIETRRTGWNVICREKECRTEELEIIEKWRLCFTGEEIV